MNSIKKFFLFSSGADLELLKKCPTDINKYIGIGGTVIFTAILALFSASYALYTVFDSIFMALFFGFIWAMMIYNLDRYIVGSMKNQGSFFKDFGVALPRLLMAVLLALVISKPLELKIFEKEIKAELIVMEQEVFKNQEDHLKARFEDQLSSKKEALSKIESALSEKEAQKNVLVAAALEEADGTGGSMKRNMGPIYKAKKAEADKALKEYEELRVANTENILELQTDIAAIEEQVDTEINALERSAYGGLAARIEALGRLTSGSREVLLANLFIILLFIAIETAPIFVKLIAPRSPYDNLLSQEEIAYTMARQEHNTLLTRDTENKIAFERTIGKHKLDARISAEKELIDLSLKQRVEELKKKPISWKGLFINQSIIDGSPE